MERFESPRQKKINSVLQKEIASLLLESIRRENISNLMISVTKVKVSPDLSSAKVYVSIFPNNNYLDHLRNLNSSRMRHDLSQKMKKQLSKIPQLSFYIDDSLDYIENIEKELKAGSNPFRKSTK
jgi:ribosome-binding factor A